MNQEHENKWLWLAVGVLVASNVAGTLMQIHISAVHLKDRAELKQLVGEYSQQLREADYGDIR